MTRKNRQSRARGDKDPSMDKQKKADAEEISVKAAEAKENPSRAWVYLIIAGLLEVVWATALKMDMLAGPIIIVLIVSFDLLIKSVKRLGIGTAYAVFTGIGTVGIILVDFLVFKETMSPLKVFLVFLLIIFIIGLRLTDQQGDVD